MKRVPTAMSALAVIVATVTAVTGDRRGIMPRYEETVLSSKVWQVFYQYLRHNMKSTVVMVDPARSWMEDRILDDVHSLGDSVVYVRNIACEDTTVRSLKCPGKKDDAAEGASFVVISDDEDFFLEAVLQLSRTTFWDSQARFLLVITTVVNESIASVQRVLRKYWTQHEVLNCIAVFLYCGTSPQCDGDKPEARVMYFNPFSNGGSFSTCLLDSCDRNIFEDAALDVNGFPLKVSMKNFPPFAFTGRKPDGHTYHGGIFLTMYGFALQNFNSLVVNNDVLHLQNTSEWCVPDSFFSQADADDILHYVTTGAHARVSTYPLVITNLVFLVPKSQMIPFWKNIFLPFNLDTWTLYWSFVVCVVSVSAVGQCIANRSLRRFDILEIIRALFFGSFVHKLLTTPERLFFISLLLFNIIFNNAYTGCFSSLNVVPRFYADIDTLNDLQQHSLKVAPVYNYGQNVSYEDISLDEYISEWYDEITDWLLVNIVAVDDIFVGLDMVIKHRNVSLVTEETYALYIQNQRRYMVGRHPLLHIPKLTILPLLGAFRVRPNFPFFNKFNFALVALCETGIAEHLKAELVSEILSGVLLSDDVARLSYSNLKIFFYMFCTGCCISIIVLFLEVFIHYTYSFSHTVSFGTKNTLRTLELISVANTPLYVRLTMHVRRKVNF